MNADTKDREITNSRTFPQTCQQVFGAFSSPELLSRWWGPKGFTNTFHVFEFKTGGRWEFIMHSPEGRDFANESVFVEISAPDRLQIEHVCAPKYVLEIKLEAHDQGTKLSWVQRFETREIRDNVLKFAGNANEENLDRLESILAEKA